MIELEFNVNKQTLTRTDKEKVVSNSSNIHRCHFKFSSDWNDKEKTATFYKYGVTATVLLDEQNCCFIPSKFLKTSNRMELQVGVFGVNGDSVITSTLVTIPLVGGSDTDGTEVEVEYNLFEQIMQRIDQVKKGEVEPQLILAAVNEYISEHPFDDVIVSEIADYVTEHIADLKGDKGDNGTNGKSAYQIAVDNGYSGTEEQWLASLKGAKGDKGADGASYDDTEIKAEINDTWEAQGELGAKNLLPYPYDNTTITHQGINWVVNDDGSVTANGTATAFAMIDLHQRMNGIAPFIPNTNRYIVSLKNGNFVIMKIALQNVQNGTTIWQTNISNTPKTITFTDAEIESIKNGINAVLIRLCVITGKTVDNVTVYPMIRLATDLNNDWRPYVMTNQTLTKIVRPLRDNNHIENTDYAIQNWMERRYRDGEYLKFNRKALDHAIVTFSIDDSNTDVSAASDLFIQKGVPLCLSTIPSKLSQVCDNGDTVLQTCLKTQNNGGEILTHNNFVIDANSNSQDYFKYFVTSKRTLEQNGLKVKGIIKAGGGADDPNIETVLTYLRSYYDYGTGFQYVTDNRYRTVRLAMTDTLDNLKARVDAVRNGGIVNFYCHGSSDMGNDWVTKISDLIDYIQTIEGAEIVTIGSAILNNYVPSFK